MSNTRWKEPNYSKSQIIKAGQTIKNGNYTNDEFKNALLVIDKWKCM